MPDHERLPPGNGPARWTTRRDGAEGSLANSEQRICIVRHINLTRPFNIALFKRLTRRTSPSFSKMSLSHLVIPVSTFPVAMAMSGLHESKDSSLLQSLNNLSDGEASVVHSDTAFVGKVRRAPTRLTTVLSTVLISLIVAFLVIRCFSVLRTRTNSYKYTMHQRRLSEEDEDQCFVSIQ